MKGRIVLMLKGMCMGFADVIPGVSGGTMALLLGIYTQLIHAIKSVDLRFVKPLGKAVKGGFSAEARADLVTSLKEMKLPWLINLGVGIGAAFAIGSKIIPSLMERYPELMLAFFFGLVLASISAPLKLMERVGARELAIAGGVAVGTFFAVGSSITPPISYHAVEVANVEDGGQTLKSVAEAGPSALPPEGIYWDQRNEALRSAVSLGEEREPSRGFDPKAKDNPYNEMIVPAGTVVEVPAPAPWFIFIAGFIAICAMVLPGISGSFILLVMGSYYFMLNALKGFIRELVHLGFPESQLVYVLLFSVGAGLGLIVFSRLLSWLLERAQTTTMAALVGLMLGCLRVIWPFKERAASGAMSNIIPDAAVYGSTLWLAIVAAVVGFGIVVALTFAARKKAGVEA